MAPSLLQRRPAPLAPCTRIIRSPFMLRAPATTARRTASQQFQAVEPTPITAARYSRNDEVEDEILRKNDCEIFTVTIVVDESTQQLVTLIEPVNERFPVMVEVSPVSEREQTVDETPAYLAIVQREFEDFAATHADTDPQWLVEAIQAVEVDNVHAAYTVAHTAFNTLDLPRRQSWSRLAAFTEAQSNLYHANRSLRGYVHQFLTQRFQSRVQSLVNESAVRQSTIAELTSVLTTAMERLRAKNDQIEQLTESMKWQQAEIDYTETMLEIKDSEITEKTRIIEALTAANIELVEDNQSLVSRIDHQHEQFEIMSEELQEKSLRISQLQSSIELIAVEHQNDKESLQQQYESQLNVKRVEQSAVSQQLVEALSLNQSLRAEVTMLQEVELESANKVTQLTEQVTALQCQLSETKLQSHTRSLQLQEQTVVITELQSLSNRWLANILDRDCMIADLKAKVAELELAKQYAPVPVTAAAGSELALLDQLRLMLLSKAQPAKVTVVEHVEEVKQAEQSVNDESIEVTLEPITATAPVPSLTVNAYDDDSDVGDTHDDCRLSDDGRDVIVIDTDDDEAERANARLLAEEQNATDRAIRESTQFAYSDEQRSHRTVGETAPRRSPRLNGPFTFEQAMADETNKKAARKRRALGNITNRSGAASASAGGKDVKATGMSTQAAAQTKMRTRRQTAFTGVEN